VTSRDLAQGREAEQALLMGQVVSAQGNHLHLQLADWLIGWVVGWSAN
jgi:hypothetical protein